jgi:pimeloyl-ACP methyl ester carboxylesterase
LAATLGAGRVVGKPAVMGFSMGGWYTLNLCATSPAGTYSKALSINPPLDLTYGLKALDRLYRAPAGRDDLAAVQASALTKLMMNQHATAQTGFQPGFTDLEASYLIGLSYRFTLRNTILTGLDLKRSRGVYRRVDPLSYQDYFDHILRPRLLARGEAAVDIDGSLSLRTREAGLMAEPNLQLVLTGNDFLLTADDLTWFRERFGDRVIYTEKGGHMGQLWWPEVKKKMAEAIRPSQP